MLMQQRIKSYSMTLALHDELLAAIARVVGAEYLHGSYNEIVDKHANASEAEDFWWELKGEHGTFNVYIERWEGYMHCRLLAEEPSFLEGKKLLWDEAMRVNSNLPARMNPYT